jgi:hypothetical protein
MVRAISFKYERFDFSGRGVYSHSMFSDIWGITNFFVISRVFVHPLNMCNLFIPKSSNIPVSFSIAFTPKATLLDTFIS